MNPLVNFGGGAFFGGEVVFFTWLNPSHTSVNIGSDNLKAGQRFVKCFIKGLTVLSSCKGGEIF